MAIPKKKEPQEAEIFYGPWAQFEFIENSGWSFFPFDVNNWLTSDDVNAMTLAERGIYITALAVQWRDGYFPSSYLKFAKELKMDRRPARTFLQEWGSTIFTCLQHPCSTDVARVQHGCDIDATWMSKNPTSVQQTCCKLVNGKLHFLAINKGKVVVPKNTDRDREQEGEGDKTDIAAYYNPTRPLSITREEWLSSVTWFSCLGCNELSAECECPYTCRFCSAFVRGKTAMQNHLQAKHKDELCL